MKFLTAINRALDKIISKDKNVVFYGEDLLDPYGGAFKVSKGLSTKFPDQVISTPISEATIVGMSAGMAIGGLKPIVEIMFGDFLALTIDQLLNHLTKYRWMYNNQISNSITIRTAMGGRRGYGPTHSQSLEALLANIPMLSIVSPNIYSEPGQLLSECVLNDENINIFSEYKLLYPQNLQLEDRTDRGFPIKRSDSQYPTILISNSNFEKPDILIFTFGGGCLFMENVMAELLIEHELIVECIIPTRIKPFNAINYFDKINKVETIVFFEESPIEYGWSSEVIASISENNYDVLSKNIIRIGAPNIPIPSSADLEQSVLPDEKDIISQIEKKLGLS